MRKNVLGVYVDVITEEEALHSWSIIRFFQDILSSKQKRVLSRGVKWGVYVGARRPAELSDSDEISFVTEALDAGILNRKLVEPLGDMNGRYGDMLPCSFFPVWASSNFLLRLIESTNETALEDQAKLLLDHDMRLTSLFRKRGLNPDAVDDHLKRLKIAERRLAERSIDHDLPARLVSEFVLVRFVNEDEDCIWRHYRPKRHERECGEEASRY
jgi:hypothetical protein